MNHFLLRSRYKSYFDIIIRNINQRKRTVPSEPVVREKCNWIFCTWYCISNIIKYICDIFVSFYDLWHKFISIKFEIENYKCLHDLTIYHSSCCFWKIKKDRTIRESLYPSNNLLLNFNIFLFVQIQPEKNVRKLTMNSATPAAGPKKTTTSLISK